MGEMADWCLDQMFDPEYDYDEEEPLFEDKIWFPKPRRLRRGISIDIDVTSIQKELLK